MITNYHRPKTLDEALTLLAKPNILPLGGGTLLSTTKTDSVEVIDLQALGLNIIKKQGNNLEVGATVTLQQLFENNQCPPALKAALKLEAPLNIRNMATVAGTLVSADGRSTFATMLLAMDARLTIDGGPQTSDGPTSVVHGLGDFLPLRPRGLITKILIPLNIKTAFEYVSRTPTDKPIVCAALAQWNSGRTRLALGGYSKSPMLAMDGTEAEGLEAAARNAYHEANDEWASSEYRMDIAAVLSKRCLEAIK
jgi:CO/xanthine dehydrogenase FAD-binding subunit